MPKKVTNDEWLDPSVPNIILTGAMGTGKSTVGRTLARELDWQLVDTDEMIEQRAGKTIPEIFAEQGEPGFRKIESDVARSLAGLERHVIATGGGILKTPGNYEILLAGGFVVLLEATAEEIYERIKDATHRPLIDPNDPMGSIKRLLEERREMYGQVEVKIPTTGLNHHQVAEKIIALYDAQAQAPLED